MKLIFPLEKSAEKGIGNKAKGLRSLNRKGYPIPVTWVLPAASRKLFEKDPRACRDVLRKELQGMLSPEGQYAVRSSANVEDGKQFSFAGQFTTILNVSGPEALIEAIEKVWASADHVLEGVYAKSTGISAEAPVMAVILQEMVPSEWAGVAFSKDPVSGRHLVLIEAVRGSGEELVQGGKAPVRWMEGQRYKEEQEADSDSIPEVIVDELVQSLDKLKKVAGTDWDIEWAWDGSRLWYLQCRPITSSSYPTIYSNHISKEVLPGLIKPLIWSINIPVVNSAWIRLLEKGLGKLDLAPEQLSRAFYYRAYFNMGTLGVLFKMMGLPGDSLENLMGREKSSGKSSFKPGIRVLRYLPRMLVFLLAQLNLGLRFRRQLRLLDEQTHRIQLQLKELDRDDFGELLEQLKALSMESAYWNILIPLSMQVHDRLLQRRMKKLELDYMQLDFAGDLPELRHYDPKPGIEALRRKWKAFGPEEREAIGAFADLEMLDPAHPLKDLHRMIEDFLESFGHFSESGNDFSSTPWREDPDFILDLIRTEGSVPEGSVNKISSTGSAIPGEARDTRRKGFPQRTYRRAARYRLYREMISSSYTRTYGLFRSLYLEAGKWLVEDACLEQAADIFYLDKAEIDQLLSEAQPDIVPGIREKVRQVKKEMEECRDLKVPAIIYGEVPPPVESGQENIYKGIATSPGSFEGELVVVRGYRDFRKEVEGKVLVVPYSDVGWTPILSRAGAIVSESGGILSHASIVARELAIPAISSVEHATGLKDGTRVRVNGNHGTMILLDQ